MTIQAGDIKLVASQVMDDVPEGGGAPSPHLIPDAGSNGVFADISELDRAGGRVNLRKLFAHVRTANTDGYFGCHLIVAEPFKDPRVSATLFTTGDAFDRRDAAASRMESYLARGATYSGFLFGDHIAGQMSVTLLQRQEVPAPTVGSTFVLTKNIGAINEFSQFVRVTGVTATKRAFSSTETGSLQHFERTQVVLSLSDRLAQDFPGFDAKQVDSNLSYSGRTKVSETIVADASRYYGCVPLASPVAVGDFSARAQSIFTQLVPSTRIEVPIADARMNQQLALPVSSGKAVSRAVTSIFAVGKPLYVGGAITPGTLTVSRAGTTLVDKGGLLVNGSTQVGQVDYANGVLTLATSVFGESGGTQTVGYTVAAIPALVNRSWADRVTQASQRMSYTISLDPVPVAASLRVSYRALGRWYELADDGSGALRGVDSSYGAGTLNPATGTVAVTLGAMPDVGTAVVYTWATASKVRPIPEPTGTSGGAPEVLPPSTRVNNGAGLTLALPTPRPIKPGTVSITWNDGTARSATDNSARGLVGAARGYVEYASGRVYWQPVMLPPKGTVLTLSIGEVSAVSLPFVALTDAGATRTHTLGPNVAPNSFKAMAFFSFTVNGQPPYNSTGTNVSVGLYDDGAGVVMMRHGDTVRVMGSLDYNTGALSLVKTMAAMPVTYRLYAAGPNGVLDVQTASSNQDVSFSGELAQVAYTVAGAETPQTEQITVDALEIRVQVGMGLGYPSAYLPGQRTDLRGFELGGNRHDIVGDLVLRNVNAETGIGTQVGTFDPHQGLARITEWGAVTNPTVSGVAAVVVPSSPAYDAEVATATFRTAVSPLVSGGFNLAGNYIDGTAFSVSANPAGEISTGSAATLSPLVDGSRGVFAKVDYEAGLVEVYWGRRTERNPATDPFIVDVSHMGLPGVTKIALEAVAADTLRYNAVGYSYLPLDPAILGLSPVRLPADGRVPIFRQGSFAVLGHTGTVGPATLSNGQTINCGRTRLSRVRLIDAADQVIDTGYTADLDAGLVQIVDTTGWAQPVTVEHRIEDTMLVSDAQINGQISFTRPSTHVYPVPGSYISSALVAGDVRARALPSFDQVTWTGAWADAPIGANATGTFNETLHPITVNNLGALTERWAVRFESSGTSFTVMGEHVGVIATGSTGADCAPLNPATGTPYFTIPAAGWGLGWSAGNVLRFNTVGAVVPVWVARTILQGPETVVEDDFTLLVRGDVDRP
ncbi:hypothetical protein HNQ51_001713 [Inhella inkyongensis]|uniref:Uncharacterized protein n=1 Tax=Inhella inkyongensis TaxID=392593 RepID=A0A840S7H6_9BURK|nr:hypothetical protein [Inhella inkyongensis]MBB5204399.1 hypothetical protein [Inhella inkyongensis]